MHRNSRSDERLPLLPPISYLSMWWDEQSEETKSTFKRLVTNKQLEVVAGGWVMPDEANSHYYALIDQLIEGHQVRVVTIVPYHSFDSLHGPCCEYSLSPVKTFWAVVGGKYWR